MGFCSCFNKFILVILNFIVFGVGVAVIALASVVISRGSHYHYQNMLLAGTLTLPVWTMIVGIIVTLLGFFGCCGAMKESRCMLYTYASIVTVLLIVEVTLGILVAISEAQLKEVMKKAFEKYGQNNTSLNTAIDAMQHDLECCGVTDYNDWRSLFFGRIPTACCKDKLSCDPLRAEGVFKEGCFEAIVNDLKDVTVALWRTGIILGVVQIVCICIACGLAQKRSQYVQFPLSLKSLVKRTF